MTVSFLGDAALSQHSQHPDHLRSDRLLGPKSHGISDLNSIDPLSSVTFGDFPIQSPQQTANTDAAGFLLDSISPSITDNSVDASNLAGASWHHCSCFEDALLAVQDLDEDKWKLRLRSFDQIIEIQKGIIAHGGKFLDCSRCRSLPTVLTVVLVICDRLTEMFECIHVRVQRATRTNPQEMLSEKARSWHGFSGIPAAQVHAAQLFCSESGSAAMEGTCNMELFSDEIRGKYSDEEQVYMVQGLLNLQVRNFRTLLEEVGKVAGSGARQSKIQSMMDRLSRAATEIHACFQ